MHEGSKTAQEKGNRLHEGRFLRASTRGIKRRRGNTDVAYGAPGGSEDDKERNKQGSV